MVFRPWVLLFILNFSMLACRSLPQIETSHRDQAVINSHYKLHRLGPSFFMRRKLESRTRIKSNKEENLSRYLYKVGIGDVLTTTIWGHPELTIPAGSYRTAEEAGNVVNDKGVIFYPFIGNLYVAGKTIVEIRDLMTKKLSAYIKKPQLDVKVASYRSQKIYVTGQVVKPGKQFLSNTPLTLLDAINQAGGLIKGSAAYSVYLTRNNQSELISLNEYLKRGNISNNFILQDGDIVHVGDNAGEKVFILGAVASQRVLRIGSFGLSLTEALTESGGIGGSGSDATGVFVIRAREESKIISSSLMGKKKTERKIHSDVYQLDLSNALALVVGTQFKLKPMDVVFVTSTPAAKWSYVLGQILVPFTALSAANSAVETVKAAKGWFQ